MGDHLVDLVIEVRLVVGRARDDQRGSGLVDQDRVDLIDDRENVAALDHLIQLVLHIVAKIVEPEFVVGAVGDVGRIGRLALGVVQPVNDHAVAHAKEIIDPTHPFGVAAGEIVIHRDDVDTLAGQRIEVGCQRRHEGLALAGAHFSDPALVQNHAADQLNIEMALAENPLGRFANGREGWDQQIIQGSAGGQLFAEPNGSSR